MSTRALLRRRVLQQEPDPETVGTPRPARLARWRTSLQQEPDPETVGTAARRPRRRMLAAYNRSPTPRRSGLHHPDAHHIGVVLPTTGARPRDGRDNALLSPRSTAATGPTTGARPRDGRDSSTTSVDRSHAGSAYNRSPTPRRSGPFPFSRSWRAAGASYNRSPTPRRSGHRRAAPGNVGERPYNRSPTPRRSGPGRAGPWAPPRPTPYNRSPTPRRSGRIPDSEKGQRARWPTTGARPRDGRDVVPRNRGVLDDPPTTGARPRDGRDRNPERRSLDAFADLQQEPDPETVGTRGTSDPPTGSP